VLAGILQIASMAKQGGEVLIQGTNNDVPFYARDAVLSKKGSSLTRKKEVPLLYGIILPFPFFLALII